MNKINGTIKNITELDYNLMVVTQRRLDNLTKPKDSLGRLEELAKLIVGITGERNPLLKNKVIFTFASDHGVAEEKVSAFPQEVTEQMVYNFIRGGAGINVLAKHIGARVIVADLGVAKKVKSQKSTTAEWRGAAESGKAKSFKDKKINYGTKNMTKGPAMTQDEAIKSIEAGIEIFEQEFNHGIDIIGTGEMGIANTTASTAITAVWTKKAVEGITGRGTGIDNNGLENKVRAVKQALEINQPNPNNPIDVLSKVGGFEIGGLTGVILAAAAKKIPIVIDGFISGAAALIAFQIAPKVRNYMIASHLSVERGHKAILNYLGLKPILDLELRLGEGTGAALAINIIEAAVKILTQMATFENAGVENKLK